MEKLLHLYKYVDGVNDSPFPSKVQQAILYKFKYDAKRMGNVPTITGTLMYPQCLDNEWGNGLVYVTYNGERYFLRQTPTSSYSNEDTRYKHEVDFVSERIVLNDVYFYDVVASDVSNDKPVSNSSNVTFFGDIHEFAQRLNYSLQYANVGYSVVVDEGITSEGKLVSFQDQFFANALQEIYNTYEIPYYFVGKVIHIGYTNNAITHTFKYGVNDALLSIQKTNANYKITNRVTGIGSADNIPYYYPNKDEKGSSKALYNNSSSNITIENESLYKKVKLSDVFTYTNIANYTHTITNGEQYSFENELTETSANIWELWQVYYPFTIDKISEYVDFDIDYTGSDFRFINIELWNGGQRIATYNKRGKFTRKCGLGDYEFRIGLGIYSEEHLPKSYADTIISKIKVSATQEIESEIGWYLNDKRYTIVQLSDYGLKVSTTPKDGDKITFEQIGYIKPQMNLMPPIYRESNGSERFYNALNKTYISPQTSEYYTFDNPYVEGKPKEHIVTFDDIKPSIVGITNASGQRIDMFSEFAYDANDNDEFDEEGNYLHPYFFGKLRKFDGTYGFNLFDHAIEEDEMVISMTSGSCGACNFIIGVDEETQKNIVQVDENGKLLRDANGNVLFGSPQERQNDTSKYEVWVALKKDIDTFGVIMPNASGNYKPKAGDTFVILHIDLPYGYIVAAEDRLKEQIIKYMAMNNSEKFTFSITFSRIFFAENPTILAQLDENARLQIEYNGKEYELYVSSYSYSMNDDNPLPEIRVELSDTLTISQNALQNAISEVKGDIMSSVGSIDWAKIGLKYFLRKDVDDRAKGKIASDTALEVGKFVSGASGAIIYVDKTTGQTIAELDKLYVRMKAYFEQLEIVNVNSVGGKQILSPAGALRLSNVVDNGGDYYRCYFLNEQDGESVENRFAIGDQAYCQLFNAKSGVNNNISNKYYWRLVVGVGEDYIDLSKNDCDNGSDIPSVGDVVCHKGNRNDVDRQNLIEFSSVDSYSPSIILYQGVNSYSLSGKDLVSFGVDKTTNKAFMNVYGDMYVGDRNNTSYMRYTQENGLELKGRLAIGTTLSDGRELEQAIKDAAPEGYDEFVEQVTKEFEAIRNEMDGAIDTWFGDETPTLNNYPAVDWTTDSDKDSHLGDLFYTNDGKAYRFQYTQDSGYYWAVIEDSEVVKALELAQKALDTADGKRRVFIETPFPPYDLGDLWAGGSEQPLKRCINAKGENGSYDASDWALADDSHAYTDAVKEELQGSISDTTDALNKAISDAEKAANTYTDDAKTAIQATITTLEKAKANVDDVYTKSQADEEISRAEQDAIKAAQEAADAAIVLANETVMAYADGIVTAEEEARIKQAEENLKAANKYAEEKAQEAFNNASDLIAGYSYLREALKESTTVDGGLIQSALLMLGYTTNGVFKVMSGTNGIYKSGEKGGGIAAWYGGPMADKEANSSLVEYAQSLFRFDGSGYLAGGNITWDKDGAGHVAGGDLSWDKNGVITLGSSIRISGDTNETLSSILAFINEYRNLWTYDATNNAVRTALNVVVEQAISFGGVGSGGSGSGGVTALSALTDVALGTLVDGQALVWDSSSLKWVNKAVATSGEYLPLSGGIITGRVEVQTSNHYGFEINTSSANRSVIHFARNGASLGYLGFTSANSIKYFDNSLNAYDILHSNNYSDYALSNNGGTIDSGSNAVSLLINSNSDVKETAIQFAHNGVVKGVIGWFDDYGTYIYSPINQYYLGVKNDGTPHYSKYKGNSYTLYHTGNFNPDDYLPLSGGTINGELVTDIIKINTISTTDFYSLYVNNGHVNYSLIKLRSANRDRADIGWFKDLGVYINNNIPNKSMGIKDDGTPFYDSYALIHSGNIGSQRVANANTLEDRVAGQFMYNIEGEDFDPSDVTGVYVGMSTKAGLSSQYRHIISLNWQRGTSSVSGGTNPIWQAQLSLPTHSGYSGYGAEQCMAYRTFTATGPNSWIKLVDANNVGSYNAGSATKLANSRTIWGQSFNGESNLIGTAHIGQFTNGTATIDAFGGVAYYGCDAVNNGGISSSTNAYIAIKSNTGNIGFGKYNPQYKLDVDGDIAILRDNYCDFRLEDTSNVGWVLSYRQPEDGSFKIFRRTGVNSYLEALKISTSGDITTYSLLPSTKDTYEVGTISNMYLRACLTHGIIGGNITNGAYIGANAGVDSSYTGAAIYAYGRNPIVFYTEAKERARFEGNGLLLLKNALKLSANSNDGSSIYMNQESTSGSYNAIRFLTGGVEWGEIHAFDNKYNGSAFADKTINVSAPLITFGTWTAPKMIIYNETGNVLIGSTTDYGDKLQIHSSYRVLSNGGTSSYGYSGMHFTMQNSTKESFHISARGPETGRPLRIYHTPDGSSFTQLVDITSSGRVLIGLNGSEDTGQKLQVKGSAVIGNSTINMDSLMALTVNGQASVNSYLNVTKSIFVPNIEYNSEYGLKPNDNSFSLFSFFNSEPIILSKSGKLRFGYGVYNSNAWCNFVFNTSAKSLTFEPSDNFTLTVNVTGNFVTTGAITFGSDARYKTKLSDVTIDLETIANAPLFNYVWNDREDTKEHLGTTAQYWHNTAFKNAVCPTNDEKLWTMSYSEIAVGGMITIARELLPIKREVSKIQRLEERVEKLERILRDNNIKFE